MNAKDFLKQKGILDYNEFVSYQKADSDDYIPIEELLEEYAGIQVKTCNKPAVSKCESIEGEPAVCRNCGAKIDKWQARWGYCDADCLEEHR